LVEREVVLQDAFGRLQGRGDAFLKKLKEAASKEFDRQWVRAIMQSTNVKNDQELKEFLRSQGMSLEMVRRQWERNFMAMEYLRSRVFSVLEHRIGHVEMQEYYDKHPEEFKVEDGVQWQDLFIDAGRHANREAARRLAEVLASRARAGENFAKLVETYDNGDAMLRNGEGLGRKHGEVKPPEAEPVLFAMNNAGEVAVTELTNGYHVVRLVKRDKAGLMPFDDKVQRQIKDKLRNEVAQQEMKRIVAKLKREAIIEYANKQ
jgi:parvulin-like peptidyl-prolyl isomerase